MTTESRVTQSDIARAAGVNRATVSLALRGMPGISRVTRARVQHIATQLGYSPDPMLSALATYRTRLRPATFHGNLVWLAKTEPGLQWRKVRHFTDYLAGAEARAAHHGFQIEVVDVAEAGLTWQRAASIAAARGVSGLLLCPQPRSNSHLEDLPWDKFSSVSFGYSLTRPQLNVVAAAHHRAMLTVMQTLQARGYRRIGCALRPEHDKRVGHNFLSAYFAGCTLGFQEPLPVCPDDGEHTDGSLLRQWLEQHKPDAIVSGNMYLMEHLRRWSIRVPDDLAVACPTLACPFDGLAGVIEPNRHIGEVAVDQLVAMILRGERGVPENAHRLLIDGEWYEGETVRPP